MTQDIWGVPDPYAYLRNLTDEILTSRELRKLVRMACRDVAIRNPRVSRTGRDKLKMTDSFDGKPAYRRQVLTNEFVEAFKTLLITFVKNNGFIDDEIRHLSYVLPRPKRKRALATAPALTLVERRAQHAQKKLKEWQRKSKLAATKTKAYRKRVNYYKKRGKL